MSCFLNALEGKNVDRTPVWFMRQAGRYLPSYQEIRQKYTLLEMFKNPHLASRITYLPFQDLDLDAAIIFSDILVVFEALGFHVDYPLTQGPKVQAPSDIYELLKQLKLQKLEKRLDYVFESIQMVKPNLDVPLLGFCGSPFTLLAYLLEKPMTDEIKSVKKALYESPSECHEMLLILTDVLKEYALLQIKAGADAFQIFDTASTWLSDAAFYEFSFSYTKDLVDFLEKNSIKTILFSKSTLSRIEHYNHLPLNALSIDWTGSYSDVRKKLKSQISIQGNLDPFLTTLQFSQIQKELEKIFKEVQSPQNFIFNLGHGVLPSTRVETLQSIIQFVHNLSDIKAFSC